jgi:nitrogen regulatory protein P-II 1
MKKVEAIIRSEKLDDVRDALKELGVNGLTVSEVRGHGRQKGVKKQWRGTSYTVDLLPKVKLETVVPSAQAQDVAKAIVSGAKTGEVGDGKIFILPVESIYRVRTGEQDNEAI